MAQTTKRALAASLKKLLSEKTLDKITVKDIVEDCEVNRQTFYYHFQNVYDLIGWIFLSEGEKAFEGKKTQDNWQMGISQVFQYVQDNRAFIINIYHSIGREHLEQYLYRLVFRLLISFVEEQAEGMNVCKEDKKFIADFYKYAFVGLVLEWIRTGMRQKPEYIIDKLNKLMSGDIKRVLKKYEQSDF